MEFNLAMNMDNAAFEETPGQELSRILKRLASGLIDIAPGDTLEGKIHDINGNKIGTWEIKA